MKLTIGFSPCPNDTFIFDALVNQKMDTGGLEFEVLLEDVETLNQWALEGRLDITKLSFPAFFQSLSHYQLLQSGSALGKGVGPLLVMKKDANITTDNIREYHIAIPGFHTTANLLLEFAFPEAKNKTPLIFSAIEDAVAAGQFDLGVIIHENRFTYAGKGLVKVADLGELWEQKMNIPIPLGGIAIKKNIPLPTAIKTEALIRKSLEYAFSHDPHIPDYVKAHSQTMSEEVMRKHIGLYVNSYSIDLGQSGKEAIHSLFRIFRENHPELDAPSLQLENLFLPSDQHS